MKRKVKRDPLAVTSADIHRRLGRLIRMLNGRVITPDNAAIMVNATNLRNGLVSLCIPSGQRRDTL